MYVVVMRRTASVLILLATATLSGCHIIYGTAADFAKISLGMTKAQVIDVLGTPVAVSADADKGEERLVYKRMKHALSEYPRTYEVVLRGGQVVRFGEQYSEKNISVF